MSLTYQSEQTECGLASLAMVAAHHGSKYDLLSLRSITGSFSQGMSALDLVNASELLGLSARAVKIDLEELSEISLPAILHWSFNHFLVLDKVKRGKYFVRDPAVGVRILTRRQVSDSFTGIAIEVFKGEDFKKVEKKSDVSVFALWHGDERIARPVLMIALISAFVELIALVTPFMLQLVTDELVPSGDIRYIFAASTFALILMTVHAGGVGFRSKLVEFLRASLVTKMSRAMFSGMLKVPTNYFQVRHYGDIQSRFASLETIHQKLSGPVFSCIFDGIAALICLSIMFAYSAGIALLCLACVAAYCLMRWFLHEPVVAANEEVIVASAKRQSFLLESIRGIEVIKVFGKAPIRSSQYMNLACDISAAELNLARHNIYYQFLSSSITSVATVGTIFLGSILAVRGDISIGMLVAVFAFRALFMSRSIATFDALMQVRLLDLHANRVSEITNHPLERHADPVGDAINFSPDACGIQMREMSFRFDPKGQDLLKEISLDLPAGCSLAVTGRSGCGKTTFGKIIAGLIAPTDGELLVGGLRVAVGSQRWRGTAIVSQTESIFSGTILDNIVLWAPEYDEAKAAWAADVACILPDIKRMSMGIQSFVGEGGSMLSGGQRQRIAIARAVYAEPKLLVLDEATSNLDLETERRVIASLKSLGVTIVQIAHRPQAVSGCDYRLDFVGGGDWTFDKVDRVQSSGIHAAQPV